MEFFGPPIEELTACYLHAVMSTKDRTGQLTPGLMHQFRFFFFFFFFGLLHVKWDTPILKKPICYKLARINTAAGKLLLWFPLPVEADNQ